MKVASMSVSLVTAIKLVCECLELAIANIEVEDKQLALRYIEAARQRLQELEVELKSGLSG